MKILEAGYVRLEKRCIRCGKIIHTVIPTNLLFWMWGMYPRWDCLWCKTQEEMLAHDLPTLREALQRTYDSLHGEDETPNDDHHPDWEKLVEEAEYRQER